MLGVHSSPLLYNGDKEWGYTLYLLYRGDKECWGDTPYLLLYKGDKECWGYTLSHLQRGQRVLGTHFINIDTLINDLNTLIDEINHDLGYQNSKASLEFWEHQGHVNI